jgi:c-di-GMP-binding flagellar brake protein YcgR
MIQLLDDSEKPLRMPFKVMIYDISRGGMSYIVKQSQADEAGRLLGNTMVIQTAYGQGERKRTIKRKAKIVAVRLRPFDESSVHIKFTQPLEEEVMKEIGQLMKGA